MSLTIPMNIISENLKYTHKVFHILTKYDDLKLYSTIENVTLQLTHMLCTPEFDNIASNVPSPEHPPCKNINIVLLLLFLKIYQFTNYFSGN